MRVGIVGCGWVAENRHIPAYQNIPDLEIAALCDVDEVRVKAVSGKFGVHKRYVDYKKMFENEDLNIVTIATSPETHMEIGVAAAKRGINILSEKPLAASLNEAKEIVRHVEAKKVKLMVNQSYRWFPEFETAKRILDEKMIGDVFYANIEQFMWNERFQGSYVMPNVVQEMAVHYIDLLRWLVAKDARKVYALGTNIVKQKRIAEEALATISVDFGEGAIGRIDVSWISKGAKVMEKARIDGTQGCVLVNWEKPISIFTEKLQPGPRWCYPKIVPLESLAKAFEKNMRLLIEAIRKDSEPLINGRDNLKTLRIVFGAIESMKTGKAAIIES